MKRYANSHELLKCPLVQNELGYDKIFLLGSVDGSNNNWEINIEENTPTVFINDSVRKEFGLTKNPTVQEVRNGSLPNLSLISGGAFLWIKSTNGEHLACLRRSAEALTDPSYLTGPAGRSGEKLSDTIINELNEELIIVLSENNDSKKTVLGFYSNESNMHDLKKMKQTQASKYISNFKVSMIDTKTLVKPKSINSTVTTKCAGNLVETLKQVFVFFDKENNTLEVREVYTLELPHGLKIESILNGENPNLETRLLSIAELQQERLVPALKYYISQL